MLNKNLTPPDFLMANNMVTNMRVVLHNNCERYFDDKFNNGSMAFPSTLSNQTFSGFPSCFLKVCRTSGLKFQAETARFVQTFSQSADVIRPIFM